MHSTPAGRAGAARLAGIGRSPGENSLLSGTSLFADTVDAPVQRPTSAGRAAYLSGRFAFAIVAERPSLPVDPVIRGSELFSLIAAPTRPPRPFPPW